MAWIATFLSVGPSNEIEARIAAMPGGLGEVLDFFEVEWASQHLVFPVGEPLLEDLVAA